MRAHFGWRWVVGALWGSVLLPLAACQSPGSQRIVGPDGSPMAHVHCGAEQGVCFRMAGELCPGGYEMKPVLRASDGNFLVRCRAGTAPAVAAYAPAYTAPPATRATTHTPGLMDPWPPSPETAPAARAWPSPQTSAAARSQPNAPASQGDVDVGY
jgi:hypothetical protein